MRMGNDILLSVLILVSIRTFTAFSIDSTFYVLIFFLILDRCIPADYTSQ